ncbi:unnamed protein product [Lampetra planeri]
MSDSGPQGGVPLPREGPIGTCGHRQRSRSFTVAPRITDMRKHVILNLLDTERSYVESLQQLVEGYMRPLKQAENAGLCDPALVDDMFYQVPEILGHHECFLARVTACVESWHERQTVGDLLVESFSKELLADSYSAYIDNFPHAQEAVKVANKARASFSRFLEQCMRENREKQALADLMIKPVQRIPRYELLIKDLLKHTPEEHPDRPCLVEAQRGLHALASRINQGRREAEEATRHACALQRVEAAIEGLSELAVPGRRFIRQELVVEVKAVGSKKERCLFLFSDLLLCTTLKRKSGSLRRSSFSLTTAGSYIDLSSKYKLLWRSPLHELEVVKGSCELLVPAAREALQRSVTGLEEDTARLADIRGLVDSLTVPHQALDDALRDLLLSVQRDLSERHAAATAGPPAPPPARLELLLLAPGAPQSAAGGAGGGGGGPGRRGGRPPAARWSETQPRREPEFLKAISIMKTRSGMQFSCASPSVCVPLGGCEVWVCNSDGYVGQVCLLSLTPEPIVEACIAVCSARILCIAPVPALQQPPTGSVDSGGSREGAPLPDSPLRRLPTIASEEDLVSHRHRHRDEHGDERRDEESSSALHICIGDAAPAEPLPIAVRRERHTSAPGAGRARHRRHAGCGGASGGVACNPFESEDSGEEEEEEEEDEDEEEELEELEEDEAGSWGPHIEPSLAALREELSGGGHVTPEESSSSDDDEEEEEEEEEGGAGNPFPPTPPPNPFTVDPPGSARSPPLGGFTRPGPDEASCPKPEPFQGSVWLGTEDGCIHIYQSSDTIRHRKKSLKLQHSAAVTCIVFLENKVFVSLANGDLVVYHRDEGCFWAVGEARVLPLSTAAAPVCRMLAVSGRLWCGCQSSIVVLHPDSLLVEASFVVDGEGGRGVACMASEGSGVWVALTASTQVRLYHPATYECLAEVDVTAAVSRMLAGCDAIIRQHKSACLRVTSLTPGAELLWVGTSAGVLHDPAGSPGPGAPSPPQRWPAAAPVGCLHGHTGHVRFITSVRLPEGCVWAQQGGAMGAPDQTPKAPRRDSGKRLRASGLPGVLGGAGPAGGHAGGPGALLVISGGDGYEEFTGSPSPGGDDAAGRDDSTNHLLLWRV